MLKYDIDLLTDMKAGIKNAGIIGKIRTRIGEKLENTVKNTGSSRLLNSAKKYNYSVIITDNTHYQLLKINKNVVNSYFDLKFRTNIVKKTLIINKNDAKTRTIKLLGKKDLFRGIGFSCDWRWNCWFEYRSTS